MSKHRVLDMLEAFCLGAACMWIFRAPTGWDIVHRFGWTVLFALVASAVFTVARHWIE